MSDRRALFFLLASVVCLLLLPLAGSQYRDLTLGVGGVYALLAVASFLDHRSRH